MLQSECIPGMRYYHKRLKTLVEVVYPHRTFDNWFVCQVWDGVNDPYKPYFGASSDDLENPPDDVRKLLELGLDEIKALWDKYDGANAPSGYQGEDIHLALNLLGEGEYCAV